MLWNKYGENDNQPDSSNVDKSSDLCISILEPTQGGGVALPPCLLL